MGEGLSHVYTASFNYFLCVLCLAPQNRKQLYVGLVVVKSDCRKCTWILRHIGAICVRLSIYVQEDGFISYRIFEEITSCVICQQPT